MSIGTTFFPETRDTIPPFHGCSATPSRDTYISLSVFSDWGMRPWPMDRCHPAENRNCFTFVSVHPAEKTVSENSKWYDICVVCCFSPNSSLGWKRNEVYREVPGTPNFLKYSIVSIEGKSCTINLSFPFKAGNVAVIKHSPDETLNASPFYSVYTRFLTRRTSPSYPCAQKFVTSKTPQAPSTAFSRASKFASTSSIFGTDFLNLSAFASEVNWVEWEETIGAKDNAAD